MGRTYGMHKGKELHARFSHDELEEWGCFGVWVGTEEYC